MRTLRVNACGSTSPFLTTNIPLSADATVHFRSSISYVPLYSYCHDSENHVLSIRAARTIHSMLSKCVSAQAFTHPQQASSASLPLVLPPHLSVLHSQPTLQEAGEGGPVWQLGLSREEGSSAFDGEQVPSNTMSSCRLTERHWSVNTLLLRLEVAVSYVLSPDTSYHFEAECPASYSLQRRLWPCGLS